MREIIKKLNDIEGVVVKEANVGFGSANKISIEIEKESDYIKWSYFLEKLKEEKPFIQIKKAWPQLTFIFPNKTVDLNQELKRFEGMLDKKYYLIEKPLEKSVTVIAKITNCCNIDCQYCYDRPFREKLGHNGIIDIEKIDHLFDMASKYAEEITVVWHGGEPTLAGTKFFRKICEEVIPKYPYAKFDLDLQTNGTLLNEEWFELSKEFGIGIGSSYNATQEDLRETRKTNELGKEGHTIYNVLDNVKKANEFGLGVGVIDVMTKENHERMKDIYEFYKKEGITSAFNEIHNAGEAEKHDFLFITKEDQESYDKVATEYFTYWVNDQSEERYIDRYASEYIQVLLTGRGTVCHNSGNCIGQWLGINSNGDLYPCDRALPDKYRIGNVMQFNDLSEVFESKKYRTFADEREKKKKKCQKCNLFHYCKGNCPMVDIDEHGSAAKSNVYTCQMNRLNYMCAYKALLNTDIDKCNKEVRNFLIDNCLFLPQEIPALLERLGIADKFQDYDFSEKTANVNSKEFKLFTAINSPKEEEWVSENAVDIGSSCEEYEKDNRLDVAVKKIHERAVGIVDFLQKKKLPCNVIRHMLQNKR